MKLCENIPLNYLGELYQWARSNCMPLCGSFELTPFCNFQCVMCYIRLNKEQAQQQGELLRAADWIAIAKQAKEMGMLNLCLTGGEPLSHPDFWEIYSELNKMGFMITLLTNGALIDEEVMEKFREYGAPCFIKITLYGASDETYQRTCHCSDGFTRVSKAVKLLQEAGIPLKIVSTIVKENMADLPEIYRFAMQRKIPVQHTIDVVKSARGAVNTAETSRLATCDFPEELTLEALERMKRSDRADPFAGCGSRDASFWMTWNGRMQLCAFLAEPYVSYSGDFQADWAALNEKLNGLCHPEECKNCQWRSFCRRCPGVLCAESGDPEKVDADFCHRAEKLYELYITKLEEVKKR